MAYRHPQKKAQYLVKVERHIPNLNSDITSTVTLLGSPVVHNLKGSKAE